MKHTPQSDSEKTSAPELTPYRRARAFGYTVINALLEGKFAAGIHDVAHFEQVIQDHLAMEPNKIAPWHRSPLAQAACRDGMRLAALNFYWEHRDAIQVRLLAASFGDEIAAAHRAAAEMPDRSDDYLIGRCEQIKARLDTIRQRYPDLAQALSDGLALLTFETSQVQ